MGIRINGPHCRTSRQPPPRRRGALARPKAGWHTATGKPRTMSRLVLNSATHHTLFILVLLQFAIGVAMSSEETIEREVNTEVLRCLFKRYEDLTKGKKVKCGSHSGFQFPLHLSLRST